MIRKLDMDILKALEELISTFSVNAQKNGTDLVTNISLVDKSN